MRPHLSLDVRNVPASVTFYEKVFGTPPQKQTVDYAKFDLSEPALSLSLVSSSGRSSSVNHLGIGVDSIEEINSWKHHLQKEGILEKVEEDQTAVLPGRTNSGLPIRTATPGKSSEFRSS